MPDSHEPIPELYKFGLAIVNKVYGTEIVENGKNLLKAVNRILEYI